MFDAIAGHDPQDATSLTDPTSSTVAQLGQRIDGLRIGIDRDYALKGIDPGQAASIEDALKVLAGLGAQIVDVKMPDMTVMVNSWVAICAPEALAFHKAYYPSRASDYGHYFRQMLAVGRLCDTAAAGGRRRRGAGTSARALSRSPNRWMRWPARLAAPPRGRSHESFM